VGVELETAEVQEFLAGAHTGVLTTVRRDGSPIGVPMWFVVLDGAVHLRTPARTRKVARLRHDPRASFVVESGRSWIELKSVVLSGVLVLVEDAAERARVDAALDAKYESYRMDPDDLPAATRRFYDTRYAHLRLDLDRPPLSWDNAKLVRPR
jgi:nitroimidazol reductase NimA-like FMN-containing flavoprotein (pyridoxamine 5'-phosphate oxidase superfamily)